MGPRTPIKLDVGALPPCSEPLLDLIHQRVHKPRRAHLSKVFKGDCLPGLFVLHLLLAARLKIERPRLVRAAEEHQRMGAVPINPYLVRREGDGLVGDVSMPRRAGYGSSRRRTELSADGAFWPVFDPGCAKTLRGIITPAILGSMAMRRATKRKNPSSARHYDQFRFRFHTTKTHC
jgi:hypothetical protein